MAKVLYIIGNGFDRYHGLDTRYQSFAFFLQKNNGEIYKMLHQYFGLPHLDPNAEESYNDPIWRDFENELASLDFESVLEDYRHLVADPGRSDFKDRDWHEFQIKMEGIVNLLTVELRKEFREFILDVEFPEQVDNKILGLEPDRIFLNFNYTDTLERYYHVQRKRILYIHGKAKIPEDDIILGHGRNLETLYDEQEVDPPDGLSEEELEHWYEKMSNSYDYSYESAEEQIKSYFGSSFKSTSEIIEKYKTFFESFSDVNRVFVLGHSIAEVDQPYFKKIIDTLACHKVSWTVTYYSDEERTTHLKSLLSLGLQESKINLVKMESLKHQLPSLFDGMENV